MSVPLDISKCVSTRFVSVAALAIFLEVWVRSRGVLTISFQLALACLLISAPLGICFYMCV
jgi:hypothetical protein